MTRLTTILWDAGGVIYNFDQGRTDRALAADCERSAEEVAAMLYGGTAGDREYNKGLVEDFNLGITDAHAFYRRVKQALGLRMGYESFVKSWNSMFKGVNNEIATYLEKAADAGILQGILSSTNPLHWEEMRRMLDLESLLEKENIICTYHADARRKKPATELFDAALRRIEKKKEEVVYVDDVKKYTDAALKYGFGAAVHVNPEESDFQQRCIRALEELGFRT